MTAWKSSSSEREGAILVDCDVGDSSGFVIGGRPVERSPFEVQDGNHITCDERECLVTMLDFFLNCWCISSGVRALFSRFSNTIRSNMYVDTTATEAKARKVLLREELLLLRHTFNLHLGRPREDLDQAITKKPKIRG